MLNLILLKPPLKKIRMLNKALSIHQHQRNLHMNQFSHIEKAKMVILSNTLSRNETDHIGSVSGSQKANIYNIQTQHKH